MIIYKTTNLINGKIYIGLDSKNRPNYKGSGKLITRAFRKYGYKNFIKEIIEEVESLELLNERERYWIKFFNSQDMTVGYNIMSGGGYIIDLHNNKDEIKKKISESKKGKKLTLEHRRNISKGQTGKKHSKEWCENISKGQKCQFRPKASDETKLKMSITRKGRKREAFSEEWKENIRQARIGQKASDEARRKMSESRKGYKRSQESIDKMVATKLRRKLERQQEKLKIEQHSALKIS